MNDQVSMNDVAARSPTGEILDQSLATTPPAPSETLTPSSTPTPDAPQPPADPAKTPDAPVPPAKTDAPGVPDKYEFKAPDNYTLDPAAYEAAIPVFKELGLTNDQAQKLIDIQVARELALAKAPEAAVTAMRTDWQTKVKADPDMVKATSGGKTGMDAVMLDIARAKNALPADLRAEFSEAMNLTGAGDHPAVVKALWKLAQYVTEGSHVAGKGPSAEGQQKPGTNTRPTAAEAMYPGLARSG